MHQSRQTVQYPRAVSLEHGWAWTGSSGDPQDEQFGDVVERAPLEAAGNYEAVLVGQPYDGAVIGRAGAREGPAATAR